MREAFKYNFADFAEKLRIWGIPPLNFEEIKSTNYYLKSSLIPALLTPPPFTEKLHKLLYLTSSSFIDQPHFSSHVSKINVCAKFFLVMICERLFPKRMH